MGRPPKYREEDRIAYERKIAELINNVPDVKDLEATEKWFLEAFEHSDYRYLHSLWQAAERGLYYTRQYAYQKDSLKQRDYDYLKEHQDNVLECLKDKQRWMEKGKAYYSYISCVHMSFGEVVDKLIDCNRKGENVHTIFDGVETDYKQLELYSADATTREEFFQRTFGYSEDVFEYLLERHSRFDPPEHWKGRPNPDILDKMFEKTSEYIKPEKLSWWRREIDWKTESARFVGSIMKALDQNNINKALDILRLDERFSDSPAIDSLQEFYKDKDKIENFKEAIENELIKEFEEQAFDR